MCFETIKVEAQVIEWHSLLLNAALLCVLFLRILCFLVMGIGLNSYRQRVSTFANGAYTIYLNTYKLILMLFTSGIIGIQLYYYFYFVVGMCILILDQKTIRQ